MRKRKRDWPIRVYRFAVKSAEIPEQFWTCCHKQQDLWNALVVYHTRLREELASVFEQLGPLTDDLQRRAWIALRQVFENQATDIVAQSGLDWMHGPDVLTRFMANLRNKTSDWPREQHGLRRVRVIRRFTAGGLRLDQITKAKKSFYLSSLDKAYCQGEMSIEKATLKFGAVIHPQADISARGARKAGRHLQRLPTEGFLKRVDFCGSHDVFGWAWSLNLTIEAPVDVTVARVTRHRVAGLDLGWRYLKDESYIRIGMIADSDGRLIELGLPLNADTASLRRFETLTGDKIGMSYWDLARLQGEIDDLMNETKSRLAARNGHDNLLAHLSTIKQPGLARLRRELSVEHPLRSILNEWVNENEKLRRRFQGLHSRLLHRRDWFYGNIAAWLARTYDTVVIEAPLQIKEMIEGADTAQLEAARRYHQWCAVADLRARIMSKVTTYHGKTKNSTRECEVCGDLADSTGRLVVTCPRGHSRDQDERAAINLLSQISPESKRLFGLRQSEAVAKLEMVELPEQLRAVARLCSS